jgi:hypothetical protein
MAGMNATTAPHTRHSGTVQPATAPCRPGLAGAVMVVTLAAALIGCATVPPTPDWQADAHGAIQRAIRADLEGLAPLAAVEWAKAEAAVTRTARADLLARVALTRCAIAQARLDGSPCLAFVRYADAATVQDRAYHGYLNAAVQPDAVNALPEAHRPVALSLSAVPPAQSRTQGPSGLTAASSAVLLRGMPDPVARLVAGSVLWRAQRLDADALQVLVDTASHQGWQGALMAWLVAQRTAAEQAGQTAVAEAAQRRIELLSASAPARPAPKAD